MLLKSSASITLFLDIGVNTSFNSRVILEILLEITQDKERNYKLHVL